MGVVVLDGRGVLDIEGDAVCEREPRGDELIEGVGVIDRDARGVAEAVEATLGVRVGGRVATNVLLAELDLVSAMFGEDVPSALLTEDWVELLGELL